MTNIVPALAVLLLVSGCAAIEEADEPTQCLDRPATKEETARYKDWSRRAQVALSSCDYDCHHAALACVSTDGRQWVCNGAGTCTQVGKH